MRISYKALGNMFTFFVLFLSTGAFLSFIVGANLRASEEGSPVTQATWALVYLIVIARAAAWYRQLLPLIRANKCLFSLLLLAMVSAAWSTDPVATLHHGVALLGTTLFGIDFALRYSIRQQLRLVCIVLGLVVALGIATQIFFPGLLPHVGADPSVWQGSFDQKNTFGAVVVLALVAFLSRPRHSRRATLLIFALIAIAGALVVASHSASSLVELVSIVLISPVLAALRWRPSKLAVAGFLSVMVAIPVLYLTLTNVESVTAALGRDSTLTGRTELWRVSAESVAQRPLLGYGYDVFWEVSSPDAARIRSAVRWDAPHAHNGYLGLLLDLGLAGLLLYGAAFAVTARRAILLFRRAPASNMIWPLLFLMEVLLLQTTETSIVIPNSIHWILYIAVTISICRPSVVMQREIADGDPAESLPEPVLTEA